MATAAAARSVFRSTSVRSTAARFASAAKSSSSRPTFRAATPKSPVSSHRIFRCPVELSSCMEMMQPFHTVTASALMTSMLSMTRRSHMWVIDGIR